MNCQISWSAEPLMQSPEHIRWVLDFLMEHPEDLGRTASGDVPAALWQYGETRDLQVATEATTWALFQCPFGAVSSKPTRLMSDLARASEEPFQGLPFFDGSARYLGPLPHVCPHGGHKDQLNGKRKDAMGIKSSNSTSYTAGLCLWLASMIVRSFFPLKKGLIVEAFSKARRLLAVRLLCWSWQLALLRLWALLCRERKMKCQLW